MYYRVLDIHGRNRGNTMKNTTAHIKDLEAQIDYLTGYQPSGEHWKKEYYIRKSYIVNTIASELTPVEVCEKIARIQQSIINLREGKREDQSYMKEVEHHEVTINWHDKPKETFLLSGSPVIQL